MTSLCKKSFLTGTLPLLALLCAALLTAFTTGNPAHPPRSFRGVYEGNVTVPADDPVQQITITATGNATHLGQFLFTAEGELHLETLQLTDASATFTAANGDELYTEYSSSGSPNDDGTFWVTADHNIVGGTGRFAGATGSFTTNSTATIQTTTETVTISGKVNMQGMVSY